MSLYSELTTPNGLKYTQPTGLFIGGKFVKSKSGKYFETIDPSTENVITRLHEADADDVEAAVLAAEAVQEQWGETAPYERTLILNKIADLIEAKRDLFAAVETWDNGKTLRDSLVDVDAVVKTFRYYAGWADKYEGRLVETDSNFLSYIRHEPIGVCGMIVPWNFPLQLLSWKVAPALAMGNSFILKSAESTPLTALLFAEITAQIPELPKGVVNVLSGFGPVGGAISAHPRIKKVTFTGSTRTGRLVLESAAKSNIKKVTLELGGKSPHIVFDDANFEDALKSVIAGIFFHKGEVCCAGSRLFLHSSIYDKFLGALKSKVEALKIGNPYDADVQYGPQTNAQQYQQVLDFIEHGKQAGLKVLTGGSPLKSPSGKGYYIQPTVFVDVSNDHRLAREEIFGPVLVVVPFETAEEVVKLANDNDYGLGAGVHTQNVSRAVWVANHLKTGSVWVNTYGAVHYQLPFGGYGLSGIGRELGQAALAAYTETKTVRIAGINRGAKI